LCLRNKKIEPPGQRVRHTHLSDGSRTDTGPVAGTRVLFSFTCGLAASGTAPQRLLRTARKHQQEREECKGEDCSKLRSAALLFVGAAASRGDCVYQQRIERLSDGSLCEGNHRWHGPYLRVHGKTILILRENSPICQPGTVASASRVVSALRELYQCCVRMIAYITVVLQ